MVAIADSPAATTSYCGNKEQWWAFSGPATPEDIGTRGQAVQRCGKKKNCSLKVNPLMTIGIYMCGKSMKFTRPGTERVNIVSHKG